MPRTPLLHPGEYFRERAPGLSFGRALVIALLVALLTTAAVGFVGWQFSEALDTTVTAENDNRPPDWVCEQHGDDWPGCDQPETRELNLGDELWDRFAGLLPVVFLSSLLGWAVVGAVLHLLSRGGDRGTFGDTLAVAAWGGVPMLVESAVGVVAAMRVIRETSFSQNPETLLGQLQGLSRFSTGLSRSRSVSSSPGGSCSSGLPVSNTPAASIATWPAASPVSSRSSCSSWEL
ncbi:Yip1 family protein [Haloprofundus salinisoli]|uniref:Yip1 family protein n=1 Tax=Haloprofundus salinisoli TaxID=2876193 RepID=UPI001CCB6BEE|nr:Yip1 family protein [Haloprofundus salinisoli]